MVLREYYSSLLILVYGTIYWHRCRASSNVSDGGVIGTTKGKQKLQNGRPHKPTVIFVNKISANVLFVPNRFGFA